MSVKHCYFNIILLIVLSEFNGLFHFMYFWAFWYFMYFRDFWYFYVFLGFLILPEVTQLWFIYYADLLKWPCVYPGQVFLGYWWRASNQKNPERERVCLCGGTPVTAPCALSPVIPHIHPHTLPHQPNPFLSPLPGQFIPNSSHTDSLTLLGG